MGWFRSNRSVSSAAQPRAARTSGTPSGPLPGPVGSDPVDDTPPPTVTNVKGPNPGRIIGPGGTLPGSSPP
jgi:hypothetical protein